MPAPCSEPGSLSPLAARWIYSVAQRCYLSKPGNGTFVRMRVWDAQSPAVQSWISLSQRCWRCGEHSTVCDTFGGSCWGWGAPPARGYVLGSAASQPAHPRPCAAHPGTAPCCSVPSTSSLLPSTLRCQSQQQHFGKLWEGRTQLHKALK